MAADYKRSLAWNDVAEICKDLFKEACQQVPEFHQTFCVRLCWTFSAEKNQEVWDGNFDFAFDKQ